MDQKKIGAFIAARRKEKGMTQVQFAEKLGVTNKAVSKWETGKCLPDAALFEDVCSLLEITLNEFFSGEKIPEKDIATKAEENLLGVVTEYQERSHQTTLNAILFGIGLGLIITSALITHLVFKCVWVIIAALLLTITSYRLYIMGGRMFKIIKIVSLISLAICILCTVDLGLNYANALLVDYHDGIILTGVLSRLIYGDRGWSLPAFFHAFSNMLTVTVFIVIENIVLCCFSIIKGK